MERRLAAILVSDVVGYSRMVRADEEGTLAAVRAHRVDVVEPSLAAHHGRVVKLMGDGMLVEFPSVVDAVHAAIDIQTAVEAAAEGLPEERRIRLRIGVNLGDVVIDEGDIHGDGVNVAARLEALAEPGSVYVSGSVHEQVRDRMKQPFEDLGEREVKNIDRPVRIWRWAPGGTAEGAAGTAGAAKPKPAPENHSIVVLPFTNMSRDEEQEYFSDGMTEDIITDLSRISGLLVIARNTAFTYKGRAVNIPEVCAELGVRYALEGSIRKAGARVRITAQLIDGTTGGHIWAERYDRDLTDIFEVQDEVTRNIVEASEVRLSRRDQAAIAKGGTRDVEAHDLFLRGRALIFAAHRDRKTFEQGIAFFERAIALDPDYAEPYAGIAMLHNLDYQNRWSNDPDGALGRAADYAAAAIERDDANPFNHYTASLISMLRKDYANWAASADRALELSPNYPQALNARALVYVYTGEPAKALAPMERAMRLDPAYRPQIMHFVGVAYLLMGDYARAAETFRKRIALSPRTDLTRGFLVAALGRLGEVEAAREVWRELKEINPDYDPRAHIGRLPFRNAADADRVIEGFRLAGVLE